MVIRESAPRCIECGGECPNGFQAIPQAAICQNIECGKYGLLQAGADVMEEIDRLFPIS